MDYNALANQIIEKIGGAENVVTLEHCSTRLRFALVDRSKIDIEKGSNVDYNALANQIIEKIGGAENVVTLEHCSTRLRFALVDRSKIDIEGLKKVSGVMGVIDAAQFQVVIGNNVVEVYEAILKGNTFGASGAAPAPAQKQGLGATLLAGMVSIFQPLVPAIAGAGVLKSLLLLVNLTGLLAATDPLYMMLAAISDATFYFLPLMVAVTAADTFRCNRLVALGAVGYLLLPATGAALAEGAYSLFGLVAPAIAYNSQVFPAVLCVGCLAVCEHFFNRVSPKPIRIFFVPMMALAITIPATLFILGPLGYNLGQILTTGILSVYDTAGFLALGILAAILPFMIAMGMHKALIPYATAMMGELGYEMLYLPASLAHNISESGACFAVALRTKNSELRQTALSAGISALMGITEPALYGVTLQHKRAMIGVVASGAISGTVIGLLGIKAFALVGPGLASMTMYTDPSNSNNLLFACACFALAIAASFVITFILWKDEQPAQEPESIEEPTPAAETESASAPKFDVAPLVVVSPVAGTAEDLEQVSDEVFASKALGDGIAIVPSEGVLVAPCDAEVAMVFPTNHAIGLKLDNGCELLIHVGVDTVKMEGEGFSASVATGDKVKVGDALLGFDIDAIEAAGFDATVSMVVSNGARFKVGGQVAGQVAAGDKLFTVEGR